MFMKIMNSIFIKIVDSVSCLPIHQCVLVAAMSPENFWFYKYTMKHYRQLRYRLPMSSKPVRR
jgi:hypothetical protein